MSSDSDFAGQYELNEFIAEDVAKLEASQSEKEREVRQRIVDRKTSGFKVRFYRNEAAAKEKEARQLAADASGMPELMSMTPTEIASVATEREELDAAFMEKLSEEQMNEKMNIYSFRQLCNLLQKLNRLDHFVRDLEAWVEGTYVQEANKSKESNESTQEMKIAAYIRTLLTDREEKLSRIENRRVNIAATAAELKRGHHQEQRQMDDPNRSYERSTSPRRNEDSDDDDTVKDLRVITSDSAGESDMLLHKINRLQKERSDLIKGITNARTDAKRAEMRLKTEHSQHTTKCRTHLRVTDELQRANGALITSMELLMQQLNIEYYGLSGPTSKGATMKTIK